MQPLFARLIWIAFASSVEMAPITWANADADDEDGTHLVAPEGAGYNGERLDPRVFSPGV